MTTKASATIVRQHAELAKALPFEDTDDFEAATRGFIGRLEPGVVKNAEGHVVWDIDSYAFVQGEAPETVNPSLWRQSQLLARQGLFEVVPGIYQVRGLDLSIMTLVEGDTGVVVIDPLISQETAAAALGLYRTHRGDRPVTGVIYTHSHVDHFGGVKGVTTQEDVDAGRVPVLAPEGLVTHAVSENVYAGTAMARRAGYMYGAALDRGPTGGVGAGLGQTTSTGSITLIPPTVYIATTGQEEVVDGVRMIFQMAPGSEAPAEMHFYFPDFRALCLAENATHTLHNILTIRGAVVRDPRAWAGYLTEAIDLFGDKSDVAFASHHWPTWGRDKVVGYLSLQRDLYAYLHDQTLRMMNAGMVGSEIAEAMVMPPALEQAWHTRGYYGSVSHNVKAIYQRYMGWYDGNPANLWQHPPVERAVRYLAFMGGADAVVDKARASYDEGDYRWVAEVLSHVVFAEPGHAEARELLADTLEQLGYGSGERHLALRLPLRRARAPSRRLRHPDRGGLRRHGCHPRAGPALRLDGHQGQRPEVLGRAGPRRRRPRRCRPVPATAGQRRADLLQAAADRSCRPDTAHVQGSPAGPARRRTNTGVAVRARCRDRRRPGRDRPVGGHVGRPRPRLRHCHPVTPPDRQELARISRLTSSTQAGKTKVVQRLKLVTTSRVSANA